jgi:hypothetical protein
MLMDYLSGLPVNQSEGGAQRLMAADNLVEAELKDMWLEAAPEADGGRDVIEGAERLKLVEYP